MKQIIPAVTKILRNRNFRLLWIGQGTSLFGDQVFLIAVTWLVLQLTNDSLALGIVLALFGVPRALFTLLGGAISDRRSPRTIMLAADILRFLLTAFLAILLLAGWLQRWMMYPFALLFGIISGFFNPAATAMMPAVVQEDELPVSNSIYQGTAQLSSFFGPVLAGSLIAFFARMDKNAGTSEINGIAAAVAIDSLTFLVSIATLYWMKLAAAVQAQAESQSSIIASIREGIRFVWNEPMLRVIFALLMAANFLFVGPLLVGIPVLADTRLEGGAAAYGTVMGAFGGGVLLGIVLAGSIIRILKERMSRYIVTVIVAFGAGMGLLGFVTSTPVAFLILLLAGIGNGTLMITGLSFLQRQAPKEMLGRIMSLILLASVGLVPISQALTGALIRLSLPGVFAGAGILMMLVALWVAAQPETLAISRILSSEK